VDALGGANPTRHRPGADRAVQGESLKASKRVAKEIKKQGNSGDGAGDANRNLQEQIRAENTP
jgi:hypothetical protein